MPEERSTDVLVPVVASDFGILAFLAVLVCSTVFIVLCKRRSGSK